MRLPATQRLKKGGDKVKIASYGSPLICRSFPLQFLSTSDSPNISVVMAVPLAAANPDSIVAGWGRGERGGREGGERREGREGGRGDRGDRTHP